MDLDVVIGTAWMGFGSDVGGGGDVCVEGGSLGADGFMSVFADGVGESEGEGQSHLSFFSLPTPIERLRLSIGKGNTMVELCSVEMALSVCR